MGTQVVTRGFSSVAHIVVLTIAILFAGCKKDDGPTNTGGGSGSTGFIKIPFPGGGSIAIPTFGATNIRGLMATLYDSETNTKQALALFFGSSMSQFVYAGTVTVNSNHVDTSSVAVPPLTTIVFYARPKPTTVPPDTLVGVEFDGSTHSWNVGGSGGIPALNNLDVTSPDGIAAITSPTAGATISLNQALTVSWTNGGNDSIVVIVRDPLRNSIEAVATGTSHTFPASSMATLVPGNAQVEVNRVGHAKRSAGGGTFLALASTMARVNIFLQ